MLKKMVKEQELIREKTGLGGCSEEWEISVGGERTVDVRSPKSLLNWIEKELKPEVGGLPITVIRISTGEREVF